MQATPSLVRMSGTFLRLGATAYGGPAMIGQIRQTVINECGWLAEEDFLQGLAFIQTIPGGTVPQMVAYVGYRLKGIPGALAAVLSYLFPSFMALVVLSIIYFKAQTLWFRAPLFKGLSAIAVAIALNACLTLGRPILRDWQAVLIAALSFVGFVFRLNMLAVLAAAGMAAFLLYRKEKESRQPAGAERSTPRVNKHDLSILGLLAALICTGFAVCYFIDPQLTRLSLRLAKIGTFMFGGGFTVIGLIQYEVVDQFRWINTKEFLDGIALGQLTPGPMMITAFIGARHSGLAGAILATIALMSPSFFIMLLVLPYHDRLKDMKSVRIVERGILASFIGMLGLVLYNFGRAAFTDVPPIMLSAAAFFALVKKVGLPYIIVAGGILSLVLFGSVI